MKLSVCRCNGYQLRLGKQPHPRTSRASIAQSAGARLHILGHCRMLISTKVLSKHETDSFGRRSSTKPASTRSFSGTSSESTTFATESSVRNGAIPLYYLNGTHHLTMNTVASKCGFAAFEDGAVTNSPEHIKSYIDGTIERLGFAPDLYYLHRIDPSKCFHPPFSLLATSTY